MAVDSRAYRDAVGTFVTGVTLCTTVGRAGQHGITANSFTSISLDPLLCMVSVEKVARFHDEVLAAGVFAVSVLGASHLAAAQRFAVRGRPEGEAQFDIVAHEPGPETGCFVVSDALAVIECRLWSQADGGDHTMVVGEVLAVSEPGPRQPALLYAAGHFRTLTP